MLAALALMAQAIVGDAPPSGVNLAAAASTVVGNCALLMAQEPTRAEFTAKVREIGRGFAADPKMGKLIIIDDADGRGCRSTFTGSIADANQMSAVAAKMTGVQVQVEHHPIAGGGEVVRTTVIDPRP